MTNKIMQVGKPYTRTSHIKRKYKNILQSPMKYYKKQSSPTNTIKVSQKMKQNNI